MQTKIYLFLILITITTRNYAQSPSYVVDEDYTNPNSLWWEPGDEYSERLIENGMYISKAARMHAQLEFKFSPYNNPQEKNSCEYASDMEFTIVKLKGDKKSFVTVYLEPSGAPDFPYVEFSYNEEGQWQVGNHRSEKIYSSGTVVVEGTTNRVRIEHRGQFLRFLLNNAQLTTMDLGAEVKIMWQHVDILARNKKLVIALDHLGLKGYQRYTKFADEIVRQQEALAKAKAAIFLRTPDFPQGKKSYNNPKIGIAFDYPADWIVDEKSNLARSLSVSPGNEMGFISIRVDTSHRSIEEVFKEILEANYLERDGSVKSWAKLTQYDTDLNGSRFSFLDVDYLPLPDEKDDDTYEVYAVTMRKGRAFVLYATGEPEQRERFLSIINSFSAY